MSNYIVENPPLSENAEGARLTEYLLRQFSITQEEFDAINDFEEASPFQGDPRDGMLRYSEGDATDFTSGPGFYYYYDGQWNYIGAAEILTYGALVPGTGNVWDDVNATDFTGEEYAGQDGCASTALSIKTNGVVFFSHNNVTYIWLGPTGVCVGVGGTYSSVQADFGPTGTADHSILINRDQADAHPQSAITDLVSDQAQQDTNLQNHINDGSNPHNTSHTNLSSGIGTNTHAQIDNHIASTSNPHQVSHSQLPDVDPDPQDPHAQYALKGYGGISKTTDTNYGTVGSGAWTTIDNWDSAMIFSPVGVVQDVAASGLRVDTQGIYKITGTVAISFTGTNQGRVFGVRLWNDTKGTAGRTLEYFVGRNQEGVNISQGALLVEIGASEVGNLFQLQIAGVGDSFSNTAVIDALFSLARHG